MKFSDHNDNGVLDVGDQGLQGWHILVNGVDLATTDANFTLSATASSGLTVNFGLGGASVCTT